MLHASFLRIYEYLLFNFFLPQEFIQEAPFLHYGDFTVFFTEASTSHWNGHPFKC